MRGGLISVAYSTTADVITDIMSKINKGPVLSTEHTY